ncbi:MAG: TonB-dependent receptor [Saprospiraceae bacterium]|nr:TonB-dependent receptor [Saprospiraceae bacterium]
MLRLAIYRHLFKKKGRSFAISGGYNFNISDGSENLNTLNDFFSATTPTEQIKQLIVKDKNVNEIKSSVLYSEPLSEKFFIETFYNFSNLDNFSNRQASDLLSSNSRIDSLSVYYEQSTLYNRLGTVLRYSYNGINFSAGFAGQSLILNGIYALDKGLEWNDKKEPRQYNNLTPNIDFSYNVTRQIHLELSYNNQIMPPDFDALYPVLNTANPSYQIIGNPELNTEKSHEVELEFHYWNPASFSNINFSSTYTVTKDPIVYNQQTVFDPNKGAVTVSMPENMEKQNSFRTNLWTNIPIVKTKLSINFNAGYDNSITPTKINNQLDDINSAGINLGSNLNFTPNLKLVLTVGASTNFSKITYKANSTQDQDFYNYVLKSSVKWQFEKNTFFESNYNFSVYNNKKFNFDKKLPIWNASVRRILGKSKKFELRLSAFDILNKNLTLSQYASKNFVEKSETNTLSRYVLLGLTYNIKGFENKAPQRRRFMMM